MYHERLFGAELPYHTSNYAVIHLCISVDGLRWCSECVWFDAGHRWCGGNFHNPGQFISAAPCLYVSRIVTFTGTLQAKDAYENTREDTSATFTVDLFGSGGSPIYNGAVSPLTSSTGMYSASYTAVNAKTYDLFVKYGSYNIEGAPFTLTVQPTVTCGTKSTIQGSGLTAASVSPSKSAFTIQSRDQYGNSRTQVRAAIDGWYVG